MPPGKPLPKWLKPKKSNARTRAKKSAQAARKTATQRLKRFFGQGRGGRRKKTRKKRRKIKTYKKKEKKVIIFHIPLPHL